MLRETSAYGCYFGKKRRFSVILSGDNSSLCRSPICHIICHMICKRKGPQDDVLGAFLSYLGRLRH